MECRSGWMARNTTDSGKTTICMGMGTTSMQIKFAMMVSSSVTRSLAMESTPGQMAGNTKAGGSKVSNTGLETTRTKMARPKVAFGKRGSE